MATAINPTTRLDTTLTLVAADVAACFSVSILLFDGVGAVVGGALVGTSVVELFEDGMSLVIPEMKSGNERAEKVFKLIPPSVQSGAQGPVSAVYNWP